MRTGVRRVVAAVLASALTGCGAAADSTTPEPSAAVSGEVVVFAAASLTDAFEEVAETFEADHAGVDVVLNLAGSQTLAAQLLQGAPADLFASASDRHLDRIEGAGLVATRVPLASNHLAIAVEPGNPLGIDSLADLGRDDVVLVLAAEEVPAGRYSAEALAAAAVEVAPASLEVDVRAALGKVARGEADAAIVYESDVVAAGGAVDAVDIRDEHDVVATYPVARLVDAPNPDAADALLALLTSADGRAILERHGFRP